MVIPGIDGTGLLSAHAEGPRIVQIAAGWNHSLALFSDGSLYTWGYNKNGQLGDGTTTSRNTPTLIGTGYTSIAAGYNLSLALKGNELYAWGENDYGQLGDGTTTDRNTPTPIGTGYTAIAAGMYHTLALKGNELYAWGYNRVGQLGDGTTTSRNTPTLIGTGYTSIAASGVYSLSLKGSQLYAWGGNLYGQLGDGTTTDRNIPTLIGTGYTAIATSGVHSLALKDSTLYAWGVNDCGQLGNRTTTALNRPTLIGTGYTAIAASSSNSIALRGSALYTWGYNYYGQLGDGTTVDKHVPTLIGTGYTAIATGCWYTLALKGSALYSCGINYLGQLGDGTTTDRNTPTRIDFPGESTPTSDPLSISNFSIKNASLNIGDKAVFTVETGKSAKQVKLYDQDDNLVASTKSYKNKGSKRIWTFSPVMAASGQFIFRAVAGNAGGIGDPSPDVIVNVGTSNLEINAFTINNSTLNVGETVTIKAITGKLASKVSILDAANRLFASSSKPSKITSTQKIWTLQRTLTEDDMRSFVLHAQIDSKYGQGPASSTLTLTVNDNLPRIISVTVDKTTVKRGAELNFVVMTNAATTNVRILNDKNESWQPSEVDSPSTNRRRWRVITHSWQLGIRKFYVQTYQGNQPGIKIYVKKIRVIK